MIQLYFDNFRGWALPWICRCCEFNQSYQWDPSCILCLTCYLPVLKSRIYFKYSILFPMRQVRIDSLYCICHKHQCAFLPQSPVIHVAYRVRCKGGHLRIKLTFTLVLTCRMNHVYFFTFSLWLIRIYEVRSKDVATFANLIV